MKLCHGLQTSNYQSSKRRGSDCLHPTLLRKQETFALNAMIGWQRKILMAALFSRGALARATSLPLHVPLFPGGFLPRQRLLLRRAAVVVVPCGVRFQFKQQPITDLPSQQPSRSEAMHETGTALKRAKSFSQRNFTRRCSAVSHSFR